MQRCAIPDQSYATTNLILRSVGVAAHFADDQNPPYAYLNENNLEELEENALATRLGTTLLSKIGTVAFPLSSTLNTSLASAPTAAVNQGSSPGGPWTTPANVFGTGPNYASVTVNLSGHSPSDSILASGITPTIPAAATILGFSVSFQSTATTGTPGSPPTLSVALALSGSQVGAAKTLGPFDAPLPGVTYTLGSGTDLWGFGGWTTAAIIANLGIILKSTATTSGSQTTFVNNLSITFYYSLTGALPVHSLQKLVGLNDQAWRYAGSGMNLFRLAGLNPGKYFPISTTLSGQPWGSAVYSPVVTGVPYLYIADFAGMIKDNGTLVAPQQMGIFQPQYPVTAQAQAPDEIILDPFTSSSYTTVNVGSFTPNAAALTTNTTSAITTLGIQAVGVSTSPNPITLFQSVVVDTGGNAETVLVLFVTATGFIADFTKVHASGVTVVEQGLTGTVAASTTATVSHSFGGTPIAAWPTVLDPSDYIGIYLYIGDPNAIESITLQFNTANGAYFYRTIGQGPLQASLNAQTDAATAASDAIISDTLGLYTSGSGGVTGLNTVPGWTLILLQLSDFSGAGGADFNDPVMNWNNVTGYELTIVTGVGLPTTSFPILFELASLILFGGAGPDSFAGVSYDYMFTFFNNVDFTESNPSMAMTDVNPPADTNFVVPRRQPVLLTLTHPTLDPQTTSLRIYRRGGTLADNYRRIDEIPCSGSSTSYTDIWSDLQIQQADTISFVNDVPVTSPLPVPLNNTLGTAISTTNQVVTVDFEDPADVTFGGFFQSVFVSQQVTIGNVVADNFETVIVLSIIRSGNLIIGFTAFVQNTHEVDEPISATAKYGQPLNIMAVAFDQGWYGGDSSNPSNLYWSAKGNIQAVSSAAYSPINNPGDAITAIVGTAGNLFVSTLQRWWSVAPGSASTSSPTIYPTSVDHGCVGSRAWTLRDGVIYYLALDGIRTFAGGGGQYISEIIEFIWQNTGPTPIPIADPTQFSSVQVSWWNRWVFFSYVAMDQNRYRIVLDVEGKRYRLDYLPAVSMFLEEDTGTLVWGDEVGLVHLDRQIVSYDEGAEDGNVVQLPIAFNLQTPYSDGGAPEIQKNYNEFTGDFDTNGVAVTVELLFNDGEFTETIGTITTTERQRVNLNLNNGLGFQAYKVSCQLTGSGIERVFLYQAKLRSIGLAQTRQSLDTYQLRFGDDASKLAKNLFVEYTAEAPISGAIYYDGSTTPGFTFTLPQNLGVRISYRQRLPSVKFRILRCILTSENDFMVWTDSRFEVKVICQGKGFSFFPLMP